MAERTSAPSPSSASGRMASCASSVPRTSPPPSRSWCRCRSGASASSRGGRGSPPPGISGELLLSGLMLGGVYALISIGLTLIFGVLRVVNFAHGEILMVGMYVAYWAFTLAGVPPYLTAVASVPLFALFGYLIYRLVV